MRFKTVASLRARLQEHTALRVGVYGIAGIAFLFVFFLISMGVVHYTESTAFCSSCHAVMNPEVTTHRVSAHAHTDCGTCHIGPGVWPKVQAKLENVRYLWSYPLKLYETPIPSPLNTMRPARETCEQCHWPAKFYPLRLATLYDYAEDESNSLTRTLLMVNVGGGEGDPEGQGPGVHWHIQNPVYYIATDEQRQEIPWVQVEIAGKVTEYISTDANLTQEEIDQANKRRID